MGAAAIEAREMLERCARDMREMPAIDAGTQTEIQLQLQMHSSAGTATAACCGIKNKRKTKLINNNNNNSSSGGSSKKTTATNNIVVIRCRCSTTSPFWLWLKLAYSKKIKKRQKKGTKNLPTTTQQITKPQKGKQARRAQKQKHAQPKNKTKQIEMNSLC